jgi:hypothetical protein
VKNQYILEIIAQVFTFVRPQYPQRKTDKRPQVDNGVATAEMFAQFMNLGMAVVTPGDTIVGARCLDLLVFQLSVFQPFFPKARLQESAAAAAAIIVGPVRLHINEIIFTHYGLDDKAQIFRDGVPIRLPHNLAGILNGKLYFQIFVPVGIDLQFSFPDPFGVIFINVFDDKIMLNIEFFQSCQD